MEACILIHKESCYAGEYDCQYLLKEDIDTAFNLKKEVKNFTYQARGISSDLSQEKMDDLVKMYDKFIDPILRLLHLHHLLQN